MNSRRAQYSLIAACLIVGCAALTACGNSTSSGSASDKSPVVTYSSLSRLVSAAKKEGTLDLTMAPELTPFMVKGFESAYPWAKVQATQLEPPQAAAAWSSELKAGLNRTDVIGLQPDSLSPFTAEGAAQRLKVPDDALVPTSLKDAKSYTQPMMANGIVFVYNTKLISGGPSTIQDLSSPKWKGKIVMLNPTLGGSSALVLASQKAVLGDAKWKAWLKAVAANDPELTDSDSTSYAAVLRGDRPVCICDYSDYVSTPGTPLAVDYYGQSSNGVVVQPIVAVVAAAAPHPAMAALFINWMLSPTGGEKAMAQSGRAPAVPVPGFAQIEMPAQVKTMPIYGVLGSFFANATTYTSVFQSIFG